MVGSSETRPSLGAVELDQVTKRYGETVAVDAVSIAIEQGEFFTLVGPSGCGKTTTLRLIAGFEAPSTGTIRFHGTDVSGVAPEDREVGVVFQNYALFPHMTVSENISYGLKFTAQPSGRSVEERVQELLELVDLHGMGDRDPDSLSGGQQQRVAIARALAPSPEVLLLDEPMSALDAQLREQLRVKVRAIQAELGITTVYVTHDQEEALAISDRVAVMQNGQIEQIGPPREIYRRPDSRFVAEFLGDNNVFTGSATEVRREDGVQVVAVRVGPVVFSVGSSEGEPVQRGDQVTFCVRPDRLVENGDENVFEAQVENAEFLGETTRVHLSWAGYEVLVRSTTPLDGTVLLGFSPSDAQIVHVDREGREHGESSF